MFLDTPPDFPVVLRLYAHDKYLFLIVRCGTTNTQLHWDGTAWGGPGPIVGESLAYSLGEAIHLLLAGDIPDGLLASLVHQLRDPASLFLALSVMDS